MQVTLAWYLGESTSAKSPDFTDLPDLSNVITFLQLKLLPYWNPGPYLHLPISASFPIAMWSLPTTFSTLTSSSSTLFTIWRAKHTLPTGSQIYLNRSDWCVGRVFRCIFCGEKPHQSCHLLGLFIILALQWPIMIRSIVVLKEKHFLANTNILTAISSVHSTLTFIGTTMVSMSYYIIKAEILVTNSLLVYLIPILYFFSQDFSTKNKLEVSPALMIQHAT